MKKALVLIASLFAFSVFAADPVAPAGAPVTGDSQMKTEETSKVESETKGNKKMKKTKKEVKSESKTEAKKDEAHH
jgi:hypothetical protein